MWHPDIPVDYRDRVVCGDARMLSEIMPDNSIDLIFTDPPYLKEYLPLYGWLANESARLLKPGGYLFAYGAGEHIPELIKQFSVPGLQYFWLIVLLHNGGYPRVWYKHLMSGYKPVFVYTKGKPGIAPWQSTVCTDSADKRFHEWGQGTGMALKTIELLTKPGDIVFDPFCGSGTVPAVCRQLGRHHIAFEIDPATAHNAQHRIDNTQPPLFVLDDEQLSLDLE